MKILDTSYFVSERVKARPITNVELDKAMRYVKKLNAKSFFVMPVRSDLRFINSNPHWIEMSLHNSKGVKCATCYIFDEKHILKDAKNFVDPVTMIFVANVTQDELIHRLEEYEVPVLMDAQVALANEKWIEAYSVYQFNNEYIRENK